MNSPSRHRTLVAIVVGLCLFVGVAQSAEDLPLQLSDQEFWKLVTGFSEPGGNFHSDNFVSNERSFQHVLTDLAKGRQPGSAYIGVGPEQNFTYLLAVKPRIAFIVDIRRQNMIEHLMYKALFELSADRVEFVSRLFSRPRPPNVGKTATVAELFEAFHGAGPEPKLYQDNLAAIKNRLIKGHGFALSAPDEQAIEYIFAAFLALGPSLTYDGPRVGLTGAMPGFEELMRETDKQGLNRSFLATEDNYLTIQQLQKKNLLVPIVGDFAGMKALRSVGQYLKEHNATVTAFYTSNVEQYLFMNEPNWRGFYANVSTLPVTASSVFVRGLIRANTGEYSPSPALPPTSRYETGLFSISDLVSAYDAGLIRTYNDILR